jgi:hypothetical protein
MVLASVVWMRIPSIASSFTCGTGFDHVNDIPRPYVKSSRLTSVEPRSSALSYRDSASCSGLISVLAVAVSVLSSAYDTQVNLEKVGLNVPQDEFLLKSPGEGSAQER